MLDEQFKHGLNVQKLWQVCCIWWAQRAKEHVLGLVAGCQKSVHWKWRNCVELKNLSGSALVNCWKLRAAVRHFVTLQTALCKGLHSDILHRGQSQVCFRTCRDSGFYWGPTEKKTAQAFDLMLFVFLIVLAHAFWLVTGEQRTKDLSAVHLSFIVWELRNRNLIFLSSVDRSGVTSC